MNYFIASLFFLLVAPAFSMDPPQKSDLAQRLQQLHFNVKRSLHQALIYRDLRFGDAPHYKFVALDEELVKLTKESPWLTKEIRNCQPMGDEKTIVDELRKQYYLAPARFEFVFVVDADIPEAWFPLEVAFVSDNEDSRDILLTDNFSARLPKAERQPGHKSLRLPNSWQIPQNTRIKYENGEWREVFWTNFLQKNVSFILKNNDYLIKEYREEDWQSLFHDENKLIKFGFGNGMESQHKIGFAIYLDLEAELPFSYSIVTRTKAGLVKKQFIYDSPPCSIQIHLKKEDFGDPRDLY